MKQKMTNYSDSGLSTKITFQSFFEKIYSNPETEDACLCLQDKYNININVLLFCCWSAIQNHPYLEQSDIQTIMTRITPWNQSVIKALRDLRLSIPNFYINDKLSSLYNLVLKNELFAIKAEQALIMQMTQHLKRQSQNETNPTNRASNNIFNYINQQNITLHKIDLEKIHRIILKTVIPA